MKTALMASIGLAVVVALAGVVSLALIAPGALTASFGGSNPTRDRRRAERAAPEAAPVDSEPLRCPSKTRPQA